MKKTGYIGICFWGCWDQKKGNPAVNFIGIFSCHRKKNKPLQQKSIDEPCPHFVISLSKNTNRLGLAATGPTKNSFIKTHPAILHLKSLKNTHSNLPALFIFCLKFSKDWTLALAFSHLCHLQALMTATQDYLAKTENSLWHFLFLSKIPKSKTLHWHNFHPHFPVTNSRAFHPFAVIFEAQLTPQTHQAKENSFMLKSTFDHFHTSNEPNLALL